MVFAGDNMSELKFRTDEPKLGTIGHVEWMGTLFLCQYQTRKDEHVWGNGAVFFKKNTPWSLVVEADKVLNLADITNAIS
jgi:hypothetical protein